jgi:3-oxoacyl-[acyl-carrier protein] reductase
MGVLEGSRAVVTGGASGIGLAIATAFAAEGADVTIFDRAEEDRLAAAVTAAAQAGGKVHARRVDVACEEEIVTAFEALAGAGGIDILAV